MKHPVSVIYVYKFLKNCSFWLPVYVLFLQSRGLNYSQIGILFGVQSISQALGEYPTGAGADLWSRKGALVISGILKIFYISIVILTRRFELFVLAYLFYGLSLAFENGADSAYIFEYLKRHEAPGDFIRVESRSYFFHLISRSVAGLAGSIMAAAGLVWPVIASWVAFIFAFSFSLRLEPDGQERKPSKAVREFFLHSGRIARRLSELAPLQFLILFYAVQSAVITTAFVYFQPLLTQAGIDHKWFGLVYSFWLWCSALSALTSSRLVALTGPRWVVLLILMFIVIPIVLLFSSRPILTILAIGLLQGAFGILRPVLHTRIHGHCEEGERTSMLSVAGMLQCAIVAAMSPVLGHLADRVGLRAALIVLVALATVGGVPLLVHDWRSAACRLVPELTTTPGRNGGPRR